jgi:hypothetical protein
MVPFQIQKTLNELLLQEKNSIMRHSMWVLSGFFQPVSLDLVGIFSLV